MAIGLSGVGVHRQAAARVPEPRRHRVPDLRDADGRGRTPRNTIIGHSVGVAAGVASLAIFGLLDAPSVYVSGVTLGRVGAIALAVALTGGILRVVRSADPPAGATTIIVASGLLAKPRQILDILIGVLLLTIAGWCLNRLMGVPAPMWAAPR